MYDQCLYSKITEKSKLYFLLYVDDHLIAGESDEVKKLKERLNKDFRMTDFEIVCGFLGANVERKKKGFFSANLDIYSMF